MAADKEIKNWKKYWSNQDNPQHPFHTQQWYDRYASELMFYLSGCREVVDAGCGSGELLVRLAPYFNHVIAFDYSPKMVNKAVEKLGKHGIKNVSISCADMMDIKNLVPDLVDCIYSNGVIQYLSLKLLDEFIGSAKSVLKPNGQIILFNVPDKKCKPLFTMGFFHSNTEKGILTWILIYVRSRFYLWRKSLFSRSLTPFQGIGNWYSEKELIDLAEKHQMKAEFRYSIYPPYGYRFHCFLKYGETH